MSTAPNLFALAQNLKDKSLFTPAEWDVVSYIDHHQSEVSQMNIGVLKEKRFVSNGTIIRICRKLGYDGFKAFKIALAKNVEFQKYIHYDVDINKPFAKADSSQTIVQDITSLYHAALDEIQPLLDASALDRAAHLLISQKRIFIYALGDTQKTCDGFANKLIKLNKFPIMITPNHEEVHILSCITKEDVLLFVSYGAHFHDIEKFLVKDVPLITISSAQDPLLKKVSAVTLLLPNREATLADERIATFYSQFLISYILDLILALMYAKS